MRRGAHARRAPMWRVVLAGLLTVGVVVAILVAWASSTRVSATLSRRRSAASVTTAASPVRPSIPSTTSTSRYIVWGNSTSTGPPDPAAPGLALAAGNFDLPDPFLLHHAGSYYMYVSTPFGATQLNVALVQGSPSHWSGPTEVLPTLPPWALKQYTWTPAVYPVGDRYVLYFSSVPRAWPSMHCIGVAVSNSLLGPFTPSASPLVCHPEHGGDIDAQMFSDPTGPIGPAHPNYLIWKTDNNSTPGEGAPEFWAQALADDGLSVTGQPKRIYWPRLAWQRDRLEAPQMIKDPYGRLWLFYSGGGIFNDPQYAMGFALCASVFGPCSDTTSVPLIGSNKQGAGPGEETVFQGPDGSTWLLYNPWYAGQIYIWVRPAEAAHIVWSRAGPSVAIPAGSFPSP